MIMVLINLILFAFSFNNIYSYDGEIPISTSKKENLNIFGNSNKETLNFLDEEESEHNINKNVDGMSDSFDEDDYKHSINNNNKEEKYLFDKGKFLTNIKK